MRIVGGQTNLRTHRKKETQKPGSVCHVLSIPPFLVDAQSYLPSPGRPPEHWLLRSSNHFSQAIETSSLPPVVVGAPGAVLVHN